MSTRTRGGASVREGEREEGRERGFPLIGRAVVCDFTSESDDGVHLTHGVVCLHTKLV